MLEFTVSGYKRGYIPNLIIENFLQPKRWWVSFIRILIRWEEH
eukprot:UN16724